MAKEDCSAEIIPHCILEILRFAFEFPMRIRMDEPFNFMFRGCRIDQITTNGENHVVEYSRVKCPTNCYCNTLGIWS